MNINAGIKRKARELLLGKYGYFVLFIIVYYVSSLIASAVPAAVFAGTDLPVINVVLRIFLSFLLLTLVNLIRTGIARAAFCLCYERETSFRDIFYAFGECRDQFLKIQMLISAIQSVVSLVMMAFEYLNSIYEFGLWTYFGLYIAFSALVTFLNLAITLRFTFAVYVIMEQPGISASAAIRASLALTKGRYFKYLFFRLSFAGMYILGYLSLLVGFLYVLPYIEVSVCLYYKSVLDKTV